MGRSPRELVECGAVLLGLNVPSDLVREGLRMVHQRTSEMAMAAAYDEFNAEEPAPLPVGVRPRKGSMTPQPLRGEVWDTRLRIVGEHPVVVLSIKSDDPSNELG